MDTVATICGWLDRMMSGDLPVSVRICCLRFSKASASRKTCFSSQHVVKVCQSVETKLISPVTNMFSTFSSAWFLFKKESRSTSWVAVQPKELLSGAQYIQYTITGFLVWMRVRTQSLKSDAISPEGFVLGRGNERTAVLQVSIFARSIFSIYRRVRQEQGGVTDMLCQPCFCETDDCKILSWD